MNWDDLRIVAAIRDEGTYAGAGARLRIDETTVARRLGRLQRSLGVRLFDAVDGVRRATPACERLLAHVHEMARHVDEIRKAADGAPAAAGRFRIASTTAMAEEILSPRAGRLLTEHAGLVLHFLSSNENVNFSRWEADLAIRLRKPDKGDFSISKLAEIAFCFIEPMAADVSLIVCSYPPGLDRTPESRFLKARGLQERARCITDDVRVIRNLICTHRAAGILPQYLCGNLLADRRLRVTPLPEPRDAWLLVQNHLKRDPAARIVIDWVRDCFDAFAPR
jgi:DNA-binding transcriptional LysR family regulator